MNGKEKVIYLSHWSLFPIGLGGLCGENQVIRERIKVQKIIFKEVGSEVCPWTMLKQWFPKWSVFTQRGTQDNPFEGRKYFSFY